MPPKLTYEKVKHFIEVESESDCILMSEEYIKSKEDLQIKCPCGDLFYASFNMFKHNNKRTCNDCSIKRRSEYLKTIDRTFWNIELIKSSLRDSGYEILSTYYDCNEKQLFLCPLGHEFSMKLNDFNNGHRCPDCQVVNVSDKNKHKLEDVIRFVNSTGYKLLSKDYIDTQSKLTFECPESHEFKMTYGSFKNSGQRCPRCSVINRSGENHWNWQGGISPLRSVDMVTSKYKNWRLGVLFRDKFTCQICSNQSRGDLEVHHYESYSQNPDLRYALSNGITLCRYCHNSKYKGSFHNIYGTQKITKDMFQEYLIRRNNGEFDEMLLLYEGGEFRVGRKTEQKNF